MKNKEYKYFIDPLAEDMGISNITSKRILTALVYNYLNKQGDLDHDADKDIKKKLKKGILTDYDFSILVLAAESGGLENLLCEHEDYLDPDTLHADYIRPFVWDHIMNNGTK